MSNLFAAEITSDPTAAERLLIEIQANYKQGPWTFALTLCEPSSNTALLVDVHGPLGIGRLTWWSDESVFVEALKEFDGSNLLSQHLKAQSTTEFLMALELVVQVLSDTSSSTVGIERT